MTRLVVSLPEFSADVGIQNSDLHLLHLARVLARAFGDGHAGHVNTGKPPIDSMRYAAGMTGTDR